MFNLCRTQYRYWNTAILEIGPLTLSMTTTRGRFLPELWVQLVIYFRRGSTDV